MSRAVEPAPRQALAFMPAARPGVLRSALAPVLLTGSAAAVAASGHAGLWTLLVTVVVAHRLADRRLTVLANVPAASLLTVVTMVVSLSVSGELSLGVTASTLRSRLLLVALSVVVVPWLTRAPKRRPRLATRDEVISCCPAAVVLALATWLHQRELPHAVGGLLNGWDNGAHLLTTAALLRSGDLSYDTNPYPRGLHALVALLVASRGATGPTPEALEALLRTQSLVVWVLYAFLTSTVSLCTLRCARLRGLPDRTAVQIAVLAGLATLTPSFFNFTMLYGFMTTIGVALVLAVVTLELMLLRGPLLMPLIPAAAVAATAHTYQLALPVVGVPLLAALLVLLRHRPQGSLASLTAVGALLAAACPPAWSVLLQTGIGVAAASGAAGPLPVLELCVGLVATLWLAATTPSWWARTFSASVATLLAVTVGTAGLAGASLTDYYPRKMLWHVALMALPVTLTGAAVALRVLRHRTRGVWLMDLSAPAMAAVGAATISALAVPGPYLAVSGAWGLSAGVVEALLQPADANVVCRLDSRFERQVAHRLLNFYDQLPTVPPLDDEGLPPCRVATRRS